MADVTHINTESPAGRRFVREMAKLPKLVEFENNCNTTEITYMLEEIYNNGLDNLYDVDMRMQKLKLK